MLYPIVLAGGVGSRLWPMSRALLPKQFVDLPGQNGTLFQNTLKRIQGLDRVGSPVVVCNESHRFIVAEQLNEIGVNDATILLEPIGRNTAPAVALAAHELLREDADAEILVLASDHTIADIAGFHSAICKARELVAEDLLATFGIVPTGPETGYGYLQRGQIIGSSTQSNAGDLSAYSVKRFVEKPSLSTAQEYLTSGEYSWNSGMFLFAAKKFLDELGKHATDIALSCEQTFSALLRETDFIRIPETEFSQCRSESIDYAVMEKAADVAMVPLDVDWNDLGAWDALWSLEAKSGGDNVINGDVLTENTSGSYIYAQSRLVATVGMSNTVIVETPDAVLVANKSEAQSVKSIVDQLKKASRPETENHTVVFRPWGSYESLAVGEGFQVKHIIVKPGASLSLQMHHHRAEHWTVIKGKGIVHCDGEEIELGANQSTFIPLGAKHRLLNRSNENVELIEVQVGDYLGEDDIVRFEDVYGRVQN